MKSISRILLLFCLTTLSLCVFANDCQSGPYRSKFDCEDNIYQNPYGITFFKPTYLLLLNYSDPTIDPVVIDPNNNYRPLRSSEVAFQISLQAPLLHDILGSHNSLNIAYSQKSFWQAYVKSAYFRESNYQPEIFWKNQSLLHYEFYLGVSHESNGRGGIEERSWNRAYFDVRYLGDNFFISVKPWLLIFQSESSDLHNPDISDYMGYGRILFGLCVKNMVFSFQFRNALESGFSRGAVEFHMSFPLSKKIRIYTQVFSGYGQSLIEYNHYTNSAGIGIAFSDWLLHSYN